MKRSAATILAVSILALSLILVAKIGSQTMIQIKNKGDVTVKGFAKKEIRSDLAVFSVTLVAENAELAVCDTDLRAARGKLADYLKEAGIPDEEIKLYPPQVEEKYKISSTGTSLNEIEKYVLRQTCRLQSTDVEKIEKLSVAISDLLNTGIKLYVTSPQFFYSKLDDLKVEMIGNATENARQRAGIIASKGRFGLGPISSVRVGVFQITPMNSTDVSDYGISDTSSILKEIKSIVEIQYFVK